MDPSAEGTEKLAAELSWDGTGGGRPTPPYDARDIFTAARRSDELAGTIVAEIARRIAAHIAPLAAVADPELVVLGGGLGLNGDLLLEPVRALLQQWLPYPPRIELSTLGESAVLMGAVATGLQAALDNVFVNRPRAVPA
jgi:predicted NBD/HSP70 family sugar kinase